MNLGELLQELRENILHDRSDLVSGDDDRLWSDETLVRYINEAHRRFARRSLVIRDAVTPEVTQVTLLTGVETYNLHPAVFSIVSARHESSATDLPRIGHSLLSTEQVSNTLFFDINQLEALPAGAPVAFSTDEGFALDDDDSHSVVTLRVFPAPSIDYNNTKLMLRVVRTPLESFDVAYPNAVPEIPPDYHLDMLDWAAYLALRIIDRDAGDAKRAEGFAASFEQHVQAVKRDVLRRMFAPTTWGFGRNGFTWSR